MPYYSALKELGNIFIVDESDAKAIGPLMSDISRYKDIFKPEEIYNFAQCREDWLRIKKVVDKVIYGMGGKDCIVA